MAIKRPSVVLVTVTTALLFCLIFVFHAVARMQVGYALDDVLDTLDIPEQQQAKRPKDRPLILYAYSESDYGRENLKFFLDQGLHAAADFIFIFNGPSAMVDSIPKEANIRVVQRSNTCFDLGAFGAVLKKDDLWKKYNRFITLNASIRGPFIPFWSNQCWSDVYLDKLSNSTKLVGMAADCGPPERLHSPIYATDSIGMELMLYPPSKPMESGEPSGEPWHVGYSTCYNTFWDAVDAEISTTPMMRYAGYHVKATMASWSSNPEDGDKFWSECIYHPGDPLAEKAYYGTNIHPYETFFFKTDRGIDPPLINMLTLLHSKEPSKNRAYKLCK